MTPQKLELFAREKSPMQVSTGHCHFAAITFEKELYTWAVSELVSLHTCLMLAIQLLIYLRVKTEFTSGQIDKIFNEL